MDKTLRVISSMFGAGLAVLLGIKILDFLKADKCLDLGGKVLGWGACEFDSERPVVLATSITEIILVMVFSIFIGLLIQYCIYFLGKKLLKI